MALPYYFLFLMTLMLQCVSSQPSPGYYPSSKLRTLDFYNRFANRWGPQHQSISQDQRSATIWLDKSSGDILLNTILNLKRNYIYWSYILILSVFALLFVLGSGFKSTRPYRNGYFGASVKLQAGYTAGVNTAFYVSCWKLFAFYICLATNNNNNRSSWK